MSDEAVSSPHSFVGEMSTSDVQAAAEREASSAVDDHTYLSESALCVKVRPEIGIDDCVNSVNTVSGWVIVYRAEIRMVLLKLLDEVMFIELLILQNPSRLIFSKKC